ncbi:pickpocket protein 28-like [Tigriopus californicus]|uniref:pickpocket protein 28-like n=1 Tax=Tigriopus californicus TaxID=6832 RepID=UPI0027DA9C85|nr:pickpocket protein 28-like [Tigriopus californicus]
MKNNVRDLSAFGETSSIHGIHYVLGSNHRAQERSVWTIVVLVGLAMSLFWSHGLFQSKAEDPTMTTIESTALPIANISFPVVSLCRPGYSLARLMKSLGDMGATVHHPQTKQDKAIQLLQQEFESWPNLTADLFASHMISSWKSINLLNQIEDQPDVLPLEFMLDKSKASTPWSEKRQEAFASLSQMLQIERNYLKIMRMLLGSSMLCHEFIKHCKWNGVKFPCKSLFVLNPTDGGLCCSFHMDLKAIKENLPFMEALEHSDVLSHSALNKGNEDSLGIDMTPKVGEGFGLELILDANLSSNDPGSMTDDHQGISSSIASHSESVSVSSGRFLIAPGHVTEVVLTAIKTDTEKTLEETFDPNTRKCYFPHEYQLELYNEYSRARCQIECSLEAAFEIHNCTPWFIPWTQRRICGPQQSYLFFRSARLHNKTCHHCLADCNEVTYDFKLSSAPFRRCDDKNMESSPLCSSDTEFQPQKWSETAIQELGQETADMYNLISSKRFFATDKLFPKTFGQSSKRNEYDAFKKDISVVRYSFGKSTILHYRKRTRISDNDFIAQVGGIFGLCLGCSFISMFEILYWIITKIFRF